MLDIDFIKGLNHSSYALGDVLGELMQCSMKDVPLSVKIKASGIRLICKHIYSSTYSYLDKLECKDKSRRVYYTEGDLLRDLLVGAFLFEQVCDTSMHSYEGVLNYCDVYYPECNAREEFSNLKTWLVHLGHLNLL